MTIDEAIEVLKNGEYLTNREEEQIAEWLEELKAIKSDGFTDNLLDMGFTKGCDEVELSLYYNGWNDGYKKGEINMQEFVEKKCRELCIDYTLIFTCHSADD